MTWKSKNHPMAFRPGPVSQISQILPKHWDVKADKAVE